MKSLSCGGCSWGTTALLSFAALAFAASAETVDVPTGTTETRSTPLTGSETFVKTGGGTLKLAVGSPSFTGAIEIREGILESSVTNTAIGSAEVTISSGAAFLVSHKSFGQDFKHYNNVFNIQGAGPDGKGVLRFTGSGNADSMFGTMNLLGPATVGGSGRWGAVALAGRGWFLNGYPLTNITANSFMINNGMAITNATRIVHAGNDWVFQGGPKLDGGSEVEFVTANANGTAAISMWGGFAMKAPWTLKVEQNAKLQPGGSTISTNYGYWAGSVDIASGKKLYFSVYSAVNGLNSGVRGNISGAGGIQSVGFSNPVCWPHIVLWGTNTYTGGTSIPGGTLFAPRDGTLPPVGPLEAKEVGEIDLWMGAGGWTLEHAHDVLTNETSASKNVFLQTAKGQTLNDAIDLTQAINLRHKGAGTYNFSGKVTPNGKSSLCNAGGTMTVASCGEKRNLSGLDVRDGVLTLRDAGHFYAGKYDDTGTTLLASNVSFRVGTDDTTATTNARMIVAGSTIIQGFEAPSQNKGGWLYVHSAGTKGAILEVHPGAAITNTVHVGNGGKGACYQYGGIVHNSCTAGNDGYIGMASGDYGYYGLYDGVLTSRSWLALGRNRNSEGVFEQRGGTFTVTGSPFCIGRGGDADYHMTGGAFSETSGGTSIFMGNFSWGDTGKGSGQTVLTLAGNNPQMTLKGYLCLNERTNTAVSVLNLNAGTLCATYMQKAASLTVNTSYPNNRTNVFSYVNFGGGTFKGASNNSTIFGSGKHVADAVTLFPGGATIDVNGKTLSNGEVPFVKPTGKGLAAVTIPNGTKLDGFIGSPKVSISGGEGQGASAHCSFDAATGRIGTVEVTSPGFGFTSAPTVTFKSGDRASTVTCTATLTDGDEQPGGGLTITNSSSTAGVFTLGGANTYTGETVVAAGTLKIAAADSIPAASPVRIAGGTLDLDNKTGVSLAALGGCGTVKNGDVTAAGFVFTAADLAAGRSLAVSGRLTVGADAVARFAGIPADFPQKSYTLLTAAGGIDGAPTAVAGFESVECPQLWSVVKAGNSLRLVCTKGTVLLFR